MKITMTKDAEFAQHERWVAKLRRRVPQYAAEVFALRPHLRHRSRQAGSRKLELALANVLILANKQPVGPLQDLEQWQVQTLDELLDYWTRKALPK
jgi:hypothetical protein